MGLEVLSLSRNGKGQSFQAKKKVKAISEERRST